MMHTRSLFPYLLRSVVVKLCAIQLVALRWRSHDAAGSPQRQSPPDLARLPIARPTVRAHAPGPGVSRRPLVLVGGCGGRASNHDGGDDHTAAPRAPHRMTLTRRLGGTGAGAIRASGS